MKKTKNIRKAIWNDVNITYVPSTPPSELSLRKVAEFNGFLRKAPKKLRDRILNI